MYFVCNVVDVAGIEPAFANSVLHLANQPFHAHKAAVTDISPVRGEAICTSLMVRWK